MRTRIELAVAAALAWTLLSPAAAVAASGIATQPQARVPTVDFDARRHGRHVISPRRYPAYAPHYYARPVYYRPYPYGVPAPFVLGYGPW